MGSPRKGAPPVFCTSHKFRVYIDAMETKLFEIRDIATFFTVAVLKGNPNHMCDRDAWLWRHGGWGDSEGYYFIPLQTPNRTQFDPYEYNDRTLRTAFHHIQANFDELCSGSVIDVEHILGETSTPKETEQNSQFFA
jgi:hypothetical protein